MGEDLDPDEISFLLGAKPTSAQRRGEKIVGEKSGSVRIAPSGMWSLSVSNREPGNFDDQIAEILDPLTKDLGVWRGLASRYCVDLFCGLFMERSNEVWSLSHESLAALGLRGIEIVLDIYGGDPDKSA